MAQRIGQPLLVLCLVVMATNAGKGTVYRNHAIWLLPFAVYGFKWFNLAFSCFLTKFSGKTHLSMIILAKYLGIAAYICLACISLRLLSGPVIRHYCVVDPSGASLSTGPTSASKHTHVQWEKSKFHFLLLICDTVTMFTSFKTLLNLPLSCDPVLGLPHSKHNFPNWQGRPMWVRMILRLARGN